MKVGGNEEFHCHLFQTGNVNQIKNKKYSVLRSPPHPCTNPARPGEIGAGPQHHHSPMSSVHVGDATPSPTITQIQARVAVSLRPWTPSPTATPYLLEGEGGREEDVTLVGIERGGS